MRRCNRGPTLDSAAVFRPLRHRDFALLFTGTAVSMFGDGLFLVAIAWQAYDLKNSPSTLALVGVAWSLPLVVFLLAGGVIADAYERRRILIVSDVMRGAASASIGVLSVSGGLTLGMLLPLVALYGVGEALYRPAFTAIMPMLVPAPSLVEANALKEFAEPAAMQIAGPAVGGVIIAAAGGAGWAFIADAATFVVSIAAVLFIRRLPAAGAPPTVRAAVADLREGLRYVRARSWLWGTLLGASLAVFSFDGPLEVLLPYVVRNEFAGGGALLGAIFAAGGAGALAAAVVIGTRGMPRRPITFMLGSWAVATAALAGIAFATAAWQLFVVIAIVFGGLTAGVIVWNTLIQTRVPGEMLGRVSSLDWMISVGLVPISYAITGPLAELAGIDSTLIGAAVLAPLAIVGVLLLVPGIREPDRAPAPAVDSPSA